MGGGPRFSVTDATVVRVRSADVARLFPDLGPHPLEAHRLRGEVYITGPPSGIDDCSHDGASLVAVPVRYVVSDMSQEAGGP